MKAGITIEKKKSLNCRGRLLNLSSPVVMGILNATPDSFHVASRSNEMNALKHCEKMLNDGAAIIDIGGQSTRPGSEKISSEDELKRLLPVLKLVRKEFPEAFISIDTFYGDVAKVVSNEGADMINDISGGTMDEKMFAAVAEIKLPYILTHIQGNPQNMQVQPHYDDVTKEVLHFFFKNIKQLSELGLHDVIVDPGFGFGKNLSHNFELLNRLNVFSETGCPVLVGLSRKSMIQKTLSVKTIDALNGTTVLNTVAILKGADILRVHDVKEAKEVIALTSQLNSAN